jgi:hypothetical protein
MSSTALNLPTLHTSPSLSTFCALRKIKRASKFPTPHHEDITINHSSANTARQIFHSHIQLGNMSRFFRGDSSSESSSEDEEELYSEEEEEAKAPSDDDSDEEEEEDDEDDSSSDESGAGKKTGASKFLREGGDSDSDNSSEDERGKVISAKDKRIEELEATVKAIANGEKINDWGVISNGMLSRVYRPVYHANTLIRI